MNWDQIENNWMAMTRRIRPERPETPTPLAGTGESDETTADWPEETDNASVSAARMIA